MSRHIFTANEREELLSNPNIVKVCNSNVEYSTTFKVFAVEQHYNKGVSNRIIFIDANIPDWLNVGKYAERNIRRWHKILQRDKKQAFTSENRGNKNGQSKDVNNMGLLELQARLAYLEAENELLKKYKALGHF